MLILASNKRTGGKYFYSLMPTETRRGRTVVSLAAIGAARTAEWRGAERAGFISSDRIECHRIFWRPRGWQDRRSRAPVFLFVACEEGYRTIGVCDCRGFRVCDSARRVWRGTRLTPSVRTHSYTLYMDRATRLFELHRALSEGEPPRTAQQWAQRLGVNVRTILRDLAFLREEMKEPVKFDPRSQGYRYVDTKSQSMPETKQNKWTRLLALIHRIYAEPGKTAPELAELFDCHERTIYRDLGDLEKAGFPIYSHNGYWFAADAFLPALNLSPSELFALMVSVRLLEAQCDDALGEEGRRALEKLLRTTRESSRPDVGQMRETVQVSQATEDTGSELLGRLQQALSTGCRLEIAYQGMKDQQSHRREIDPIGLFCFRQVWYLHAWDHARKGLRNFRLSRIAEIDVTETPVVHDAKMELEKAAYHKWDVEGESKVKVVLEVTESLARWLEENPAHPSQQLEDGQAFYQVSDPMAMSRWLVSLYGYEVVEPEELRRELARLGEELVGRYG